MATAFHKTVRLLIHHFLIVATTRQAYLNNTCMTNFDELRTLCKETSDITGKVVDEFLLFYSARREDLDKEMDQRLRRFRHVTKQFKKSWINLMKAQYIAHRIFRKNGFITKYLKYAAIKALPPEQLSFLEQQSAIPWRYSFSMIKDNPAADFYEMEDAFTGESYLIFSPSISRILLKERVSFWFNLVGFNGACWQSYCPVTGFSAWGQMIFSFLPQN